MAKTEKPVTYKITVPGGVKVKLYSGIKGDSGLKHDEMDEMEDAKCKETIRAAPGHPYVEEGATEARADLFRPYVKMGVKIEKEGKPEEEKKPEKPPEKPKANAKDKK